MPVARSNHRRCILSRGRSPEAVPGAHLPRPFTPSLLAPWKPLGCTDDRLAQTTSWTRQRLDNIANPPATIPSLPPRPLQPSTDTRPGSLGSPLTAVAGNPIDGNSPAGPPRDSIAVELPVAALSRVDLPREDDAPALVRDGFDRCDPPSGCGVPAGWEGGQGGGCPVGRAPARQCRARLILCSLRGLRALLPSS